MSVRLFQCTRLNFKGEDRCASKRGICQHRHQLVLRQDATDLVILYQYNVKAMLIDFECFTDHLLEMIDLLMTLNAEIEEYAAFTWIERYPEELLLDEANFWNG